MRSAPATAESRVSLAGGRHVPRALHLGDRKGRSLVERLPARLCMQLHVFEESGALHYQTGRFRSAREAT